MTADELETALNSILGRGSSSDTIRFINEGLSRLAWTGVFSYLEEFASPTFTHEVRASVPSDYLTSIRFSYVDGTSSYNLKFLPTTEFDKQFPYPESCGNGKPEYYTHFGRYFLIDRPAPTYSDGTVESDGADPTIITGDSDCEFETAKDNGKISVGDFFRIGSTGDWVTIASIDSETQLTLSEEIDSAPADSSYEIRKSYTTRLRYIKKPTTLTTGSDVEQPLTGYDGLVIASALTFAYFEYEEYDKKNQSEARYKELLEEAAKIEGKRLDWNMEKLPVQANSLRPTNYRYNPYWSV